MKGGLEELLNPIDLEDERKFDQRSLDLNCPMTTGTSENLVGLILALLSSFFIGSSFILKKKGLIRSGASGLRAGVGGYSYLLEPLWWIGMITMIIGEVANFVAYAFSPAVLVTPLGALTIIVSGALAHVMLKEKLHKLGLLGCIVCIVGSVIIVLHAPNDHSIDSVKQVWKLAIQPAFLLYTASVVAVVLVLVVHFVPRWGHSHVMIFVGICSLMGSLSVMSVKAVGIAMKLTFEGKNQFFYVETWLFIMVVITCILTQMVYLNKALDTFNTAIVSPIYYVMFTSLTIVASIIMFKAFWMHRMSLKFVDKGLGWTKCNECGLGTVWLYHNPVGNNFTAHNQRWRSLSFMLSMSLSLWAKQIGWMMLASTQKRMIFLQLPLYELFLSP